MPGEPPVIPVLAGRVAGAFALGGGSGVLCTLLERCETEPVTSREELCALEPNGLASNRWVSELQATAVTESDAIKAKRRAFSQRRGSATQRIGVPTHTQQNEWSVNSPRVNKRLSLKESLNPNVRLGFFRHI